MRACQPRGRPGGGGSLRSYTPCSASSSRWSSSSPPRTTPWISASTCGAATPSWHDSRLYLALAYGHWFTYSPFAAIVFVPVAALPLAVARVLWDLVSVAALAYSCVIILKLAGYRPSRIMVAGFVGGRDGARPGVGDAVPRPGQPDPAGPDPHRYLARLARLVPAGGGRRRGDSGRDQADARHLHRVLPAGQADEGGLRRGRHVRPVRAHRVPGRTARLEAVLGAPVPRHQARRRALHQQPVALRGGDPDRRGPGSYRRLVDDRLAGASPSSGWPWPPSWSRRQDWLGATAVTGTTGLLVSPISWAHHWVWILPALVLLVRAGHRIAAAAGYLLFAVAPFWFTPHAAGPREYGFHWLLTLVANCFLIAGLAFLRLHGLVCLPAHSAGGRSGAGRAGSRRAQPGRGRRRKLEHRWTRDACPAGPLITG